MSATSTKRTIEEVDAILEFAKLSNSELLPGAQCLSFAKSLENDHVKLLELDPEMMSQLKKGDSLVMRGAKTDTAVLCTKTQTFEVKSSETSNTLLLVPGVHLPNTENVSEGLRGIEITAVIHSYMEVQQCRPRLANLRRILEECAYQGAHADETQADVRKYNVQELLSMVQASEGELQQQLKQLHVLELNGCVRVLQFEYLCEVLSHVVSLVDEESWSLDAVPLESCLSTLSELYPSFVIEHVLSYVGEKSTNNAETIFKISEAKVCQVFGEMVLRPINQCSLTEFQTAWQACLPAAFSTRLEQLEGLAIVEQDSDTASISYFPACELPEDLLLRFDALFQKKRRWTLEEITPYIRDLATEKVGISALLTKHARTASQTGTKLYSSRRPLV